tara:strand:+ start:567 stop:2465 length:1899 start_codon:yes stop_codon:yes gene_type:complete
MAVPMNPMNPFTGYRQDRLQEMAKSYGYGGENLADFGSFLEQNPDIANRYFAQQDTDVFGPDRMKQFQTGGLQVPLIGELTAQRTLTPGLPVGSAFQAALTPFEAAQNITPTAGQATTDVTVPSAQTGVVTPTVAPTAAAVPEVTAAAATPDVRTAAVTAAQLQAPTQTIEAQQQAQSNIANIQAAQQAQATQIQAPAARALQAGEVVAAPTGLAQQAAAFVEPSAQAATAVPTEQATVQGQLATLLQQFEQGEVPPWARGAVRAAEQTLAARGLGASSIAGQAILDAAIEQALPIAQLDARTVAAFETQNLTNRQQAAMARAQYRAQFMQLEFDQAFQTRVRNAATVSDIANRNFTSEQQIALENSRLTQTVDLANLNNNQAVTMAQAAALSQLDIANLNNRQQSAVQNAQNFLQIDSANLSNAQQTSVFNSQQQVQALLTDTAAENTARQLNARSQQQSDQFYDNLIASIGQNNSAQANAMTQFNAGAVNALQRFNSEIVNQREQFNARNQLAIEQSNAVWRREIATADTAAVNFQNQLNAQNILDVSSTAYANLWQEYRDVMEFAWRSGENELDRIQALQLVQAQAQNDRSLQEFAADRQNSAAVGGFVSDIFKPFASAGISALIGKIF